MIFNRTLIETEVSKCWNYNDTQSEWSEYNIDTHHSDPWGHINYPFMSLGFHWSANKSYEWSESENW